MKANCVVLEGSWDRAQEQPLILPYFQALAASQGGFTWSHRTIRCADDLKFWIKKIPKDSRSLLYVACHGEGQDLLPVGERSRISREKLTEALGEAKPGAIAFLHFGCCEMVNPRKRRVSLVELAEACNAYWVSGYTTAVDWLQSTMLDVAMVAELYLAFARAGSRKGPKLQTNAKRFVNDYEQLARRLGLSGVSHLTGDNYRLFPARLHNGKNGSKD